MKFTPRSQLDRRIRNLNFGGREIQNRPFCGVSSGTGFGARISLRTDLIFEAEKFRYVLRSRPAAS